MKLTEIIKLGLENNGYDGLVCPGVCGCEKNDLSPGNCLEESCAPGYKNVHSITGECIMSTKKCVSDEYIRDVLNEL